MRLVSINVARPRTVRWRGQDVRTSIYREPVDGRRMARRLKLDVCCFAPRGAVVLDF
jgi:hypothetical protein